jgi:hypothetical protein
VHVARADGTDEAAAPGKDNKGRPSGARHADGAIARLLFRIVGVVDNQNPPRKQDLDFGDEYTVFLALFAVAAILIEALKLHSIPPNDQRKVCSFAYTKATQKFAVDKNSP